MKGFRQRVQEQLSRAKDREGGKLGKSKKDSSSGTASPHGGSSQSPGGSAAATPTSSTSNLADTRNKTISGPDGPVQPGPGAPQPNAPQINMPFGGQPG
ncbi:hypothetical protein KC351_g13743, partial [Hortaea werneckii]